jgi:hypothetical protein
MGARTEAEKNKAKADRERLRNKRQQEETDLKDIKFHSKISSLNENTVLL